MVNHPLLTDPDTFPSNDVLAVALGKSFNAFEQFIDRVTNTDFNLDMQWNYYKDGKSWLCKITGNKKTVFWLSVCDGYFKTSFYFTEKTAPGIQHLDIARGLKDDIRESRAIGKLIPLIIDIRDKEQLGDLYTIIRYKTALK